MQSLAFVLSLYCGRSLYTHAVARLQALLDLGKSSSGGPANDAPFDLLCSGLQKNKALFSIALNRSSGDHQRTMLFRLDRDVGRHVRLETASAVADRSRHRVIHDAGD